MLTQNYIIILYTDILQTLVKISRIIDYTSLYAALTPPVKLYIIIRSSLIDAHN